MKMKLTII